MSEQPLLPIAVQPVISYPREAEVGKTYLMTIDLQVVEGSEWQFEEEEYPIYCIVDSEPLFKCEAVGEPAIVLHRFGGSYGSARFALTADQESQGEITITMINSWGLPVKQISFKNLRVISERSVQLELVVEYERTYSVVNVVKPTPEIELVEQSRQNTQQSLQQQLETFRSASRNLTLTPLLTHEDLTQFGVEYQTELLDQMEQAIEDCSSQDNKLFFTGHRGCGKSTLLAELRLRLEETKRYFVVMFSIADTIERSAVGHVNILFSIALQLLEASEERGIRLKPGIKKEFYRWLGKHTQTESKAVETEIEANTETTIKAGIPVILEFLAKVKSKLRINSVIRQEISIEFARRTSDLVFQINQLQAYIENATGQQVLVIIDDLDKLDLSVTETIFNKNIQSLLDLNLRIIYTVPISILRELSIRTNINTYVNKIHTMRVAKFFSKATVRKPDQMPDEVCIDVFAKILDRRLPPELMQSDVKRQIILLSGGVLRELIRISVRCCDKAMQQIRGQMRRQQLDQPDVVVDQRILNEVVTELQLEYAEVLGQVDFDALKLIYTEFKPKDTESQRFLDLLQGMYILEYCEENRIWYGLNPIVILNLERLGLIDTPISQ